MNTTLYMLRGGSWYNGDRFLRVSYRGRLEPSYRLGDIGFRIVRRTT